MNFQLPPQTKRTPAIAYLPAWPILWQMLLYPDLWQVVQRQRLPVINAPAPVSIFPVLD